MNALQSCLRKRIRLLLVFCSMLAVGCDIWAEPITFARAIELSRKQAAPIASS